MTVYLPANCWMCSSFCNNSADKRQYRSRGWAQGSSVLMVHKSETLKTTCQWNVLKYCHFTARTTCFTLSPVECAMNWQFVTSDCRLTVVLRVGRLLQGYFVQPTVIVNAADSSPLMQEEIFGPVVCVVPFDSEAEVSWVACLLLCLSASLDVFSTDASLHRVL